MNIIYNIIIGILFLISKILSPFVPKIKERKKNINNSLKNLTVLNSKAKTIWFHAASMGEFEQAKPIIEFIKNEISNKTNFKIQIVCSFFSPSGFNSQKNYKFTDVICYLPNDTYSSAKNFIEKIKPDVAVFIRYELWFNYISILNKMQIKTFLINATCPTVLERCKILTPFYKNIFNKFSEIYTVSKEENQKFHKLKLNTKTIQSSDTRFDRILQKVEEAKINPVISKDLFFENEIIFVAGSVWNQDVDVILEAYKQLLKNTISTNIEKFKLRLIFVPHEPTSQNIQYIERKIQTTVQQNTILLSEIATPTARNDGQSIEISKNDLAEKIIIVDSIGKLLKLYGVADIAYVGGGFGVGIHSITEPAGYGIPLVVGKNCFNSPDTKELLEQKALTIIEDSEMLLDCFMEFHSKEERAKSGFAAQNYIKNNCGSTKIIADRINLILN